MATTSPASPKLRQTEPQRFLYPILFAVALVLILLNVAHDLLFHRSSEPEAAAASEAKAKHDPTKTVVLPEAKLKLAQIKTEKASKIDLPTEVAVAGQITANPDRLINIHPRVSGVIRTVHGEVGARVKKGETLVVIDSADVGKGRLDLRARQRELATARAEAEWKREVAANVEDLIPILRKNTEAKEIAPKFAGKSLGSFRAMLLGGYADLEIARHEEEKQTDLFKKEIVGEHPYYLAIHMREGKQAKFEAELEQVRFDAGQQRKLADQAVRNAEAAVIDAAQRLRLLGVTEDLQVLLSPASTSAATEVHDYEDVTQYVITAPFDGTILARTAAISQRVDVTDILFSLVDPAEVRVQANVPESEVHLLPRLKDAKVRVTAEAYPGTTFEAVVIGIGSEIDPQTRSVPLRASLKNPDGLLKIGLFVRIVLDSSANESVLIVPAGAVIDIEERVGVFVPDKEPNTFHFHPVKVGREVAGKCVIRSGLKEGDDVVSNGAFLLKSELILQNETEEE